MLRLNTCWRIILQSHRVLVGSNNTPRFCTDIHKVNGVLKPDCPSFPRMEDCIDQVGSAEFVSKFDLLKGYWQVPLSERA